MSTSYDAFAAFGAIEIINEETHPLAEVFTKGTEPYRSFLLANPDYGVTMPETYGRSPLEYLMWANLRDTPYTQGIQTLAGCKSMDDLNRARGTAYDDSGPYYLTVNETAMGGDVTDVSFTFLCKDKKAMLQEIITGERINWWFENADEEQLEFISAAGGDDTIFSTFDNFISFYEKHIGHYPVHFKYELVHG